MLHTHKTDEADQICEKFSGIMITFDVKAFCCAEDDKLQEEERLYIHVLDLQRMHRIIKMQ